MKPINKILVAVDFSDHSLAAVQYAASLAADVRADLLLINVIDERDVYSMEKVSARYPGFSKEKYLQETRQRREKAFQEYIDAADCTGIVVKTAIRIGDPSKQLLDVIQEEASDLLVMSNKGRSGLVDTVVGSCARKMFRLSPVPLLSVRR